MNCKKCGATLEPNDAFCKICGTKVEEMSGEVKKDEVTFEGHSSAPSFDRPAPPAPGAQPAPQNNSVKYVCILLVVLVLVGFGIFAVNKFAGGGSGGNTPETPNNPDNPTPTPTPDPIDNPTTYSVKVGGFTLQLPNTYMYEPNGEGILIADDSQTWAFYISVMDGVYSVLKGNQDNLKAKFESGGYKVNGTTTKTEGGVEFLTYDLVKDSNNFIVAYAKLDTNHLAGLELYSYNKVADYTILAKVAPVIKSAKYNGNTSSMALETFERSDSIDLESVIEGIE